MDGQGLKRARLARGWGQVEAARRLGVSQGYLSMLESGTRHLTPKLMRKFMRIYGLAPTALPPSNQTASTRTSLEDLAAELGALGYPGFRYLRRRARKRNPAEVLLGALAQDHLEARVVEALPWLLLQYWDLDADWVVTQAKLLDLQNRLGFVVSLANRLAERSEPRNRDRDSALAGLESKLERSALAREDTLCQASLAEAERQWLRDSRPQEAKRWNLLTNWQVDHLRYAH